MAPKRILITSEFCVPYLYGGGEFRYYFLIKEFQKLGYHIDWVCMGSYGKKGKSKRREVIDGISIQHIGPNIRNPPIRSIFNQIHFSAALFWHLLWNKYDVIDAQAWIPLLPSYLASVLTRTRMVATIHDVSSVSESQWLQHKGVAPLIERVLVRLPFKTIITISESSKELLVKKFGVKEDRVEIVHGAVNLKLIDEMKPHYKKGKRYSKAPGSVIFIGRFAQNKRIQDLIEATAIAKKKVPGINVTIIGEGIEEQSLRDLVKKLRLENQIRFMVAVAEEVKYRELKRSEVLVFPSVREGFGIVLVEAMACETAVIGSRIAGIRDVISDGEDGLFVKPMDPQDIAEKMIRLLKDKKLRERLVRNARAKVERQFRWEQKAKEIEGIYFKKEA